MGANAKRRREAKAARKVTGHNPMAPTTENLRRILRQAGTTRPERRGKRGA